MRRCDGGVSFPTSWVQKKPLSGAALAKELGVSRQIIVQDIALLRANGHDIVATNRGYVLAHLRGSRRYL